MTTQSDDSAGSALVPVHTNVLNTVRNHAATRGMSSNEDRTMFYSVLLMSGQILDTLLLTPSVLSEPPYRALADLCNLLAGAARGEPYQIAVAEDIKRVISAGLVAHLMDGGIPRLDATGLAHRALAGERVQGPATFPSSPVATQLPAPQPTTDQSSLISQIALRRQNRAAAIFAEQHREESENARMSRQRELVLDLFDQLRAIDIRFPGPGWGSSGSADRVIPREMLRLLPGVPIPARAHLTTPGRPSVICPISARHSITITPQSIGNWQCYVPCGNGVISGLSRTCATIEQVSSWLAEVVNRFEVIDPARLVEPLPAEHELLLENRRTRAINLDRTT